MKRRSFLNMTAGSTLLGVGGVGVTSADDADPRPTKGGTLPNENVSTTQVGALPGENTKVPAGDWILHDNGWLFEENVGCKERAREFANNSYQRYIIDGEVFVLDSFDDWEYHSEPEDVEPHWDCSIIFSYITPPKPAGYTYNIRWEFEERHDEGFFPVENQIEVVSRE